MLLWLTLTACTASESGPAEGTLPEDTRGDGDSRLPQDSQQNEDSGAKRCPSDREELVVYRETRTKTLQGKLSLPPGEGPFPVVVLIPGGAFASADFHSRSVTVATERLLCDNIAVFAITYRVSSDVVNPPLYPEPVTDATCAVRWLRSHAQEYSIRADRIFLSGESAGGHIAAMAGLGAGISADCEQLAGEPIAVAGVLDFYGPTNWTTLGQDRAAAGSEIQGMIDPEKIYTGSDCLNPTDPLCLQAGVDAWISGDDPPFFIAHSTGDTIIPPAQSTYLRQSLEPAGLPTQIVIVQNLEHGWAGALSEPEVAAVYDEAVEWILALTP